MTIINKLTFLLLLGVSDFFIPWNGKTETNLPKENTTSFIGQPKLINTQRTVQGHVNCIFQDRKGDLWFGTPREGVYRYDGKSFTNFTTKDGLESNMVSSIAEDRKGNIWFGTTSGVSYYHGKTFTYIPLSPPTNDFVTSILEDNSGTFWFGTMAGDASKRETEGGVWRYDGKTFKNFSKNDGLSHLA